MKHWNKEDIDLLIKLRNENFSASQIAKQLKTTMHVVNNQIKKLKLPKKIYWTDEQDKFLIENYPKMGKVWCSKQLNKTEHSVSQRAKKLKLFKEAKNNLKTKFEYIKNAIINEKKTVADLEKELMIPRSQIFIFCKRKNFYPYEHYTKEMKIKHIKYEKENDLEKIFNTYIRHACDKNREFNLTKEEFYKLTQQNCYYCGKKPEQKTKSKLRTILYNGIDRIDSNKGYFTENCVTCCKVCNIMKKNYSLDFFNSHIEKIYNHRIKK